MDVEQLCDVCRDLQLRHYLAPQNVRLLWNLPYEVVYKKAIDHVSRERCELCRLMKESLPGSETRQISRIRFESLGLTSTFENKASDAYCLRVPFPHSLRISVLGKDAYRLGARSSAYGRPILTERADRDLAKSWLERCERDHPQCSNHPLSERTQNDFPQYLIDVNAMMIIRTALNHRPRYLTLSYVWGDTRKFKLQEANAEQLQTVGALEAIYDEFSLVVQDALLFSRQLGEKYLWVDSLCICQDDLASLPGQIAIMNAIYAKSALTLVALGDDASYGLPGVRPYPKARSQHIKGIHDIQILLLSPSLQETVDESTWHTRAWTYQEELFSRRLLFFTRNQLYFNCRSAEYCEDRHYDFQEPAELASLTSTVLEPHRSLGMNYRIPLEAWQTIVRNYTTRTFRFDEDRFSAFAGIANELDISQHFPTVLGMPRNDLEEYLCWTHVIEEKIKIRRLNACSSWSWCGWTGRVAWRFSLSESGIKSFRIRVEDPSYASQSMSSHTYHSEALQSTTIPGQHRTVLEFQAEVGSMSMHIMTGDLSGFASLRMQSGCPCGIIDVRHLDLSELDAVGKEVYLIMLGSKSSPITFSYEVSDVTFLLIYQSSFLHERSQVSEGPGSRLDTSQAPLSQPFCSDAPEATESKSSIQQSSIWRKTRQWLRTSSPAERHDADERQDMDELHVVDERQDRNGRHNLDKEWKKYARIPDKYSLRCILLVSKCQEGNEIHYERLAMGIVSTFWWRKLNLKPQQVALR